MIVFNKTPSKDRLSITPKRNAFAISYLKANIQLVICNLTEAFITINKFFCVLFFSFFNLWTCIDK